MLAGCGVAACAPLSAAHWTFDVVGQFLLPAIYVLVLCALGIVALMLFGPGRKGHGAFAAVAFAVAAISWLLLRPPPALPADLAGQSVSVYQHNVWIRSRSFEEEMAAIRAADADIVALVEAWPDVYEGIAEQLSDTWPYEAAGMYPPATYTRLRLLSKYPVTTAQIRFPNQSPALLQATVATPSGPLNIVLVHFTRPWPFRDPGAQTRQLQGLLPWIDTESGPFLLLGDFNSAAWGRISTYLTAKYDLQLANNPRAGTWPARIVPGGGNKGIIWPAFAGIPIDLAFCGGGARCFGHKVAQSTGSDHYSTRFEVVLDGQGN